LLSTFLSIQAIVFAIVSGFLLGRVIFKKALMASFPTLHGDQQGFAQNDLLDHFLHAFCGSVNDCQCDWLARRSLRSFLLDRCQLVRITALSCASSAATPPATLSCAKATKQVPDDIRIFVCPLGSTINMDGSAIYFPTACIWLAILNGIEPDAGAYILLIILSTIGSAGAAPVPSSGLVLVITAYNTVFNTTGTPNGFEFIVAIDWFLDRCITALNVTGDTVVCGIISARTSWEEEETNHTKVTTSAEVPSSDEVVEQASTLSL